MALRSDGRIIQWNSGIGAPVLPLGYRYTALTAGYFHSLAVVAEAPAVRNSYKADFEAVFGKLPVSSVQVGQGVVYGGKGTGNTRPITVEGRSGSSKVNRALVLETTRGVVGTTGNKALTVAGEDGRTPRATGGALTLSFVPSFNTQGVTATSLKVRGGGSVLALPSKATVNVSAVDGSSRTVSVPLTGSGATIALGDAGVRAIGISSASAFAVDDIVFGE